MSIQAPPVKLAKLTPNQVRRTAAPVRVQAGDASASPQASRRNNPRSDRDHERHDRPHRVATPRFATGDPITTTTVMKPDRDTLPVAQEISVPFAANPEFAAVRYSVRSVAQPPRSLALESGPRTRHGLLGQIKRRNPGTAGNFDHLRFPGSRAILPARKT